MASFLINNALFWLEKYHLDGLRVDAVASMLYLDYSRKAGEWIPNEHGGKRESRGHRLPPAHERGVLRHPSRHHHHRRGIDGLSRRVAARPTPAGSASASSGTWASCTTRCSIMSRDPIHRRHHHNDLTFGLLYAFSENFVLPLSP